MKKEYEMQSFAESFRELDFSFADENGALTPLGASVEISFS
jgi:hypothetical protein